MKNKNDYFSPLIIPGSMVVNCIFNVTGEACGRIKHIYYSARISDDMTTLITNYPVRFIRILSRSQRN